MLDFSKYVGKALAQSRRHVHLNLSGKVFTEGEPKDGKSMCHRDAILAESIYGDRSNADNNASVSK